MSKFNFPKSIASRPLYAALTPQSGSAHLFVADGEGAEAILDLGKTAMSLFASAQIIYIPKITPNTYLPALKDLGAAQFYVGPSYEAALPRLRHVLAQAQMGLKVYLAGTEGLIGQALNEAMMAGIPHEAIQTEHRGSIGRRMQCVHCKGITEEVITDPYICSHCGLNLFVRDHYSRRLAAFQGVCVDAEDHGNVPEPVELYK